MENYLPYLIIIIAYFLMLFLRSIKNKKWQIFLSISSIISVLILTYYFATTLDKSIYMRIFLIVLTPIIIWNQYKKLKELINEHSEK